VNNIQKILDTVTEFILNFSPNLEKFKSEVKVVVVVLFGIVAFFFLWAFGFSMLKQF
jgi:hypothetical protein